MAQCRQHNGKTFLSKLRLALLLIVVACAQPESFHHEFVSGHYSPEIIQCAIYARDKSGVQLYGDAYSWWQEAGLKYMRGYKPAPGAVLVLRRTSHMRSGHVAVVKDLISPREINVTHSNWGSNSHSRHMIYDSMRVIDVSPNNDWTQVRFWNDEANTPGSVYGAYGFIYAEEAPL
jgi:hypothetical protein